MKVGIMQPYIFPYIGYYSLIKYSDLFVFFDTAQYITHGWINRNRILNQRGEVIYFIVPISKCPRETAIKQVTIKDDTWKQSLYGKLTAYKRRAPYYSRTMDVVRNIVEGDYGDNLSKLNILSCKEISNYLGIPTEFKIFSEMKSEVKSVNSPDEWALYITKELGGDIYVNPPGGMSFFDRSKYSLENIELQFLQSNLMKYIQRIGHFEPGLSIIDVMMFCDEKEISDMLDDYSLL